MGGLFNSTTLDVMVGLIFVYLLLAIMCSSINEWFAGILKWRSQTLGDGIKQLLDGQAGKDQGDAGATAENTTVNWLLNKFHAHPLITGMKPEGTAGGRLPSYIPSRTFATALMDIVTPEGKGPITFADLEDGVKALPDGDVKKSLLALIQNAQDDLSKAQKNIEDWFDDTMGQVSGWYKRKAAWATFLIAIALTLGTDADTIQITHNLWTNPTARAKIVAQANNKLPQVDNKQADKKSEDKKDEDKKDLSKSAPVGTSNGQTTPSAPGSATEQNAPAAGSTSAKADSPSTAPQATKDDLDSLGDILPGWKDLPKGDCSALLWGWLKKSLGLFLTIAAVSLGTPFWFDILGKLANLRNAGQKPNKSQTVDANA